jgi:arylsulfatase A-like enzyme
MNHPNIVFVFADQLRYSALACNGNPIIRTPHFGRIAREGVVFDHAFSSCPICAPYRGQLLTGRYSHRNGVMDNEYALFPGETTIVHLLGREGYRTAFFGKWHLGYGPYTQDKRHGFDDLYAYNDYDERYNIDYWHNEEGPFDMVDFAPRVETRLMLSYIGQHLREARDQPFCTFMSWIPPHWNARTSNRDYGEYPQQYNVYDPENVDVPGNVPRQFVEYAKKEIADYYGNVTALDACMSEILQALDEWDLTENTILCFTSDHGDHLSSHGFGKPLDEWMRHTLRLSKLTPYEEAVHIPFILRYPTKVRANQRTQTLFSSVDIAPTLLQLCGIDSPEGMQGKDLSHAVLGTPGKEPDAVYLQALGPGWPSRTKSVGLWRAVRTHRYTYARWKDRGGMRVLYDRKADPLEMRNLIDQPDYAEIAGELEQRLLQWIRDTGDPFDTGRRLPVTDMLDLGQVLTSPKWYQYAPEKYVEALERSRKGACKAEGDEDPSEHRGG